MPVSRRLLVCCVLPVLASCDSSPLNTAPGTTYGMITIGSPSVDTRERLINDRIEQQKWLEEQLAAAANADFSANASRSRRSVSALGVGANVNLDPAGMDAWRRSRQLQDAELAYKKQALDLDFQKLLRKKELELQKAQNTDDPSTIEASAPADLPRNAAPAADKVTQEQLSTGAATGKSLADAMVGALAPYSDAEPISTPIDQFRDRLALREEIRNEMIANNLDDRHDLRGNALYRLKFDASVLPAHDTSAYAVISVCVQPSKDFEGDQNNPPKQNDGPQRCFTSSETAVPVNAKTKTSSAAWSPQFTETDARLLEHAILRDIDERMEQVTADYEAHADSKFSDIEESPGLSLETRAYFQAGAEAFIKAYDTNTGASKTPAQSAAGSGQGAPSHSGSPPTTHSSNPSSTVAQGVPQRDKVRKQLEQFTLDAKNYVTQRYNRPLIVTDGESRANAASVSLGSKFVADVCKIGENDFPAVPRAFIIATDFDVMKSLCRGEGFQREKAVHRYMAHLGVMLEMYGRLGGSNRWQTNEEFVRGYRRNKGLAAFFYGADAVSLNLDLKSLVNNGLRRQNLELYAYGGTPRESVERIADVVTRREAFQLALGLQTLAGNAGLSALTNYMRGSEGVFAALRRQPLVVGFGHSNAHLANHSEDRMPRADFGWVIGPRYAMTNNGKQAAFRQSVVQHGLSAVISVPGWWDRVELVVRRYWVNEAGQILSTASTDAGQPYGGDEYLRYTVSLPESTESILSLLESKPKMAPEPHRLDRPLWTLKQGSPAEIVIRGAQLWRNPQVRLGGQSATSIRVLPDMRGVVAEFAKVDKEARGGPALGISMKSAPADSLPVTLTTTNGFRVVGFAKIVDDGAKPDTLRATGPGILFGDLQNHFSLNVPLPGYHDITSIARTAGKPDAFKEDPQPFASLSERELVYTPKKLPPLAKHGKVEMQLLLRRTKGVEPERIPVLGPLIYYPKKAEWNIGTTLVSAVKKNDTVTYRIALSFPPAYAAILELKDNLAFFDAVDYSLESSPSCEIDKMSRCTISIDIPVSANLKKLTLRPARMSDKIPNPFKAIALQ